MLLPEYESEIMAAPRNRRVYKFCYYFGLSVTHCRRIRIAPADWVSGMPVELMAMSYSAYHELAMRPGYLLLLSLVIYPYEAMSGTLKRIFQEAAPECRSLTWYSALSVRK